MFRILLLLSLLSPLHAFADDLVTYFGKTNNQLVSSGFKKTSDDGYTTYTKASGDDTWVRAIKPNSSAFIKDDADLEDQRLEYLAMDKEGKLVYRTSCLSRSNRRTSNCVEITDGGQSPSHPCPDESRNAFDCVTVSRRYCHDFDNVTSFWGGNQIASEGKIKECAEIYKRLDGHLPQYVHLTPDHKAGLEKIRTHFNLNSTAIPDGANPIVTNQGFGGIVALARARELCTRSSGQWSESLNPPTEAVPYDSDGAPKANK